MSNTPAGKSPCPHTDTDVKDSRPAMIYGAECARRRRRCKACGYRFTTYELTFEQIAIAKSTTAGESVRDYLAAFRADLLEKILTDILKDDFEARVARYDTANRARKDWFNQTKESVS
jgi:transcriptional regulator NrdR family protein